MYGACWACSSLASSSHFSMASSSFTSSLIANLGTSFTSNWSTHTKLSDVVDEILDKNYLGRDNISSFPQINLCRSWCTTHAVLLCIPVADLSLCANRLALTAEAPKIAHKNQPWNLFEIHSSQTLAITSILVLQIAWYWYLALAFIDVQGNYFGEYNCISTKRP
jgi:hypothetical protein